MTDEDFRSLCNVYGFAPSRALWELLDTAIGQAALAEPQIDDPAIHFCHRFAILMECMLLSNDINLDKYWDEAHALLDGYNAARDKWMEAQGQPYVSVFGKD